MALRNLSPEIQEKIKQLQNLQNQLQAIGSQIDFSQGRVNEHKSTLKELEGVTDDVKLYKNVGQIMFSSTASSIRKELSEELELFDLNLNRLKKQEEQTKKQLTELNSYLNKVVASQSQTSQQSSS